MAQYRTFFVILFCLQGALALKQELSNSDETAINLRDLGDMLSLILRQEASSQNANLQTSLVWAIFNFLTDLFQNVKKFLDRWAHTTDVKNPSDVSEFFSDLIYSLELLIDQVIDDLLEFRFGYFGIYARRFDSKAKELWKDFIEGWKQMVQLTSDQIPMFFLNTGSAITAFIVDLGVDTYFIVNATMTS